MMTATMAQASINRFEQVATGVDEHRPKTDAMELFDLLVRYL
jgi:hypothetical protein